jgi:hypothetical protein
MLLRSKKGLVIAAVVLVVIVLAVSSFLLLNRLVQPSGLWCWPGVGSVSFRSTDCLINSNTGKISFTFTEDSVSTMYHVELACEALPTGTNVLQIATNGFQYTSLQRVANVSNSTITAGEGIGVLNLSCDNQPKITQAPNRPPNLGNRVDSIWVNYTAKQGEINSSNPWLTSQFGWIEDVYTSG